MSPLVSHKTVDPRLIPAIQSQWRLLSAGARASKFCPHNYRNFHSTPPISSTRNHYHTFRHRNYSTFDKEKDSEESSISANTPEQQENSTNTTRRFPSSATPSWSTPASHKTSADDSQNNAQNSSPPSNNKSASENSEHTIEMRHPHNLHKPYVTTAPINPNKEPQHPLTEELRRKIQAHGPLSVGYFMKECLFHDKYGYYSTSENIFGRKGDFITSPEITSLFSEMVGLWVVSEWEKLGKPNELRIVELGPGRGTLMKDVLKTIEKTGKWKYGTVKPKVILVEKSNRLREEQKQTLRRSDYPSSEAECFSYAGSKVQWVSNLDFLIPPRQRTPNPEVDPDQADENESSPDDHFHQDNSPILFVAHEFFDALPVNQFQYTEKGWCEIMVDTDEESSNPEHFKFVLSPGATPNCMFARSRANVSPIWVNQLKTREEKIGRRLEVSNEAITYMQQIGFLLHQNKGSALIVDYGYRSEIQDNDLVLTLQGIKEHKNVHPLSEPGQVDLSSFVDFYLLMRAVSHFPTIRAAKVLSQRDFLYRMGIDARLMRLMMNNEMNEKEMENLYSAYTRLTDPQDMGDRFKMLCISTHDLPTAFEDIRATPEGAEKVRRMPSNEEEA